MEGYNLVFELWIGIRIEVKILQKLGKNDFNSNTNPNIQPRKGLFGAKNYFVCHLYGLILGYNGQGLKLYILCKQDPLPSYSVRSEWGYSDYICQLYIHGSVKKKILIGYVFAKLIK